MNKNIIGIIFVVVVFGCSGSQDGLDFNTLVHQGQEAYDKLDYPKAIRFWNKAYRINPSDIPLIMNLGQGYIGVGRLGKAKMLYEEAAAIDPNHIKLHVLLAQVYFQSFDFEKAEDILRRFENNNIHDFALDLIRADIYLNKNQADSAAFYYRKAVERAPDSLRARIKLAMFLKSVKKITEAEQIISRIESGTTLSVSDCILVSDYFFLDDDLERTEFYIRKAIDIDPDDIRLVFHLIQFYLATGNSIKAEEELLTIPSGKVNTNIQMVRADTYLINGKIEQAEKLISTLKNNADVPPANFELLQAKYWMLTGNIPYATLHLKSALDMNPGLVKARYFYALTHLLGGKRKLAEQSLETTLLIDPQHDESLFLISQLLYKNKQYRQSLKYLDKMLETFDEDPQAHILKGLNFIGMEEYEQAVKEFNKASLFGAQSHITDYYTGLSHELDADNDKALQYYEKILGKHPSLMDVSFRYVMLLLKAGRYDAADTYIQAGIEQGNASSDIYGLAARIVLKKGNAEKALEYLEQAIAMPDTSGRIYMQLADFYQVCNKKSKALETLHECIKAKPEFKQAWLELARHYIEGGDIITSLEIMEEGYKYFPDSPAFNSNLAWLLLENDQDLNRAMNLAQKAYDAKPDNIAFTDTLGWAYFKKGIYSQAEWLISQALNNDQDNGFLQYHMGVVLFRQGKLEKSIEFLTKAKSSPEAVHLSNQIDETMDELKNNQGNPDGASDVQSVNDILSAPKVDSDYDDLIVPDWQK